MDCERNEHLNYMLWGCFWAVAGLLLACSWPLLECCLPVAGLLLGCCSAAVACSIGMLWLAFFHYLNTCAPANIRATRKHQHHIRKESNSGAVSGMCGGASSGAPPHWRNHSTGKTSQLPHQKTQTHALVQTSSYVSPAVLLTST
jgi:hypothetical protein